MPHALTVPLIVPVMLAGGEGARLAPFSTPEHPKPFLRLPGGDSLLTQTLKRASAAGWAAPVVIGQMRHRYALLNHARAAGVSPAAILLEPAARNTALAIAVVAHWMLRHAAGAVAVFLPADHDIHPLAPWYASVQCAALHAHTHDQLCLLGFRPGWANTQLGYIEPEGDALLPEAIAPRRVRAFIEKPAHAEALLARAYWNAGQVVATPARLAHLFLQHAPALWAQAEAAVQHAHAHWEFLELSPAAYASATAQPFDRVVLEPAAADCCVVPCAAGWHDLGTPQSWEACIGPLAVAVPPFPRVDRPWGYYELLHKTPGRVEKLLTLYPGCRLSLQRHAHRDETWKVLAGQATVELAGAVQRLKTYDQLHIAAGTWHRLHNDGSEILKINEIQSGSPDEDDIERQEDDYGRANA